MNYQQIMQRMNNRRQSAMSNTKDVLNDAGDEICSIMRTYCPVDTGALRKSIHHETTTDGNEVITNVYCDARNPKTKQMYWYYVEYGTGIHAENGQGRQEAWSYQDAYGNWHTTTGQKPQPFVRPAYNAVVPTLKQAFGNKLRAEVN